MKRLFPLAGMLPALALAQANLKFQEGVAGQVPPGWSLLEPVNLNPAVRSRRRSFALCLPQIQLLRRSPFW